MSRCIRSPMSLSIRSWIDGLWIAAAAMAVSLLATLYPARNATRIAPVEALRYE